MERASAAQVIVAIFPIVGIVMSAIVVFFYLLWKHRRDMFLIQSGRYQPKEFDLQLFCLLSGLLLLGVGFCLTVFLRILLGNNMGLLGGIIPLSIGVSLLLFFVIKRRLKL